MRFYTASKLGSKRAYSHEGYLVCLDVPIARTGEMLYAGVELPELEAGKDGLIRALRDPSEVFKPEAMASFVGKPTTNDHPPVLVGPQNFNIYAKGSTQNVRRGSGGQADLLIADLLFTTPDAIRAIEGGKDEISCGYDADYEAVSPGVWRQVNITGNHVALVDEGRCGDRCAIGDSAAALQTTQAAEAVLTSESAPPCGCGGHTHDAKPARARKRKTRDMAKKLKASMLDRLRRAFHAKDEAGFEEAFSETQEAAEAAEEEQDKAEFAEMIGEAVAAAVAPIIANVEAVTTDVKSMKDKMSKDAEEAEAAAAARKEAAEKAKTTDSEGLAAYLKARGLTDEDIVQACALAAASPAKPADVLEATSDDAGKERDGKETTTDSVSQLAEFRDTVARAEILAPGVRLPVYDAKAKPKSTTDAICDLRRRALQSAFDSADRKGHVTPFVGVTTPPNFAAMDCDRVNLVFGGASELAKRGNKVLPTGDASAPTRDGATRTTIADMNKKAKEMWGPQR